MNLNPGQEEPLWLNDPILSWIALILNSYRHWTGVELLNRTASRREQAQRLFSAPFVVASHGIEADPILNYGNAQALQLWEMDWQEFVTMPSRVTAKPVNQAERTRMLQQAATQGLIRDYRGVRISRTGKRFLVEQATVWNVIDQNHQKVGQAVTFSTWTPVLLR